MTEATLQHADPEMVCPTCNARQTWSDECRRCKTDLSLLRRIWRTAEAQRQQCLRALAAGRPRQAQHHARRYAAYVGHAEASRLVHVCTLLCEDWSNALRGGRADEQKS